MVWVNRRPRADICAMVRACVRVILEIPPRFGKMLRSWQRQKEFFSFTLMDAWSFVALCVDLFYLPPDASTLELQLGLADFAVLLTPQTALIRTGDNTITLGWMNGGGLDLNFSVMAEDRITQGNVYSIKIMQDAPRTTANWRAIIIVGEFLFDLTDQSPLSDRLIELPSTAVFDTAFIELTIADGASLYPPSFFPTIQIAGRGVQSTYGFRVVAEDQHSSEAVVLKLFPAKHSSVSQLRNWTATIAASGIPTTELSDQSLPSDGLIVLPYSLQYQLASISFSLADGASIVPVMLNPTLQLSVRGSFSNYTFIVSSEAGNSSAPFTIRLKVSQFPFNNWTLVVSANDGVPYTPLTDGSPAGTGYLLLPSTAAFTSVGLLLTLPPGATVASPGLPSSLVLGARGSSTIKTFRVIAENGVSSATTTLTFEVARSSALNWTLTASSGELQTNLSLSSESAPPLTTLRFNFSHSPIPLDNNGLVYWMTGSNSQTNYDANPVGTQWIPADGNTPSARRAPTSWTGPRDGQLYLYGRLADRYMSTMWSVAYLPR